MCIILIDIFIYVYGIRGNIMSIKYKMFLVAILTSISVIGVTIIVFYFSYFGYIDNDNEQRIKRNFETIEYMFKNEENTLQRILVDLGEWDDTYKFVSEPSQEYIDSNLTDSTLKNFNLKNIIYLDNHGKMVYSKEYNIEKGSSEEFVKRLLLNSKNFDKTDSQKTGLLCLKGKIYIIGILPVTSTNKQLESNGTIIMVREIDETLLEYIKNVTSEDLTITEAHQENYKYKETMNYINFDDNVISYNTKTLEANKTIKDINNENSISISIKSKSHSEEHINYFLRNFIFKMLCLISIIIAIDIVIVNKYILKRLSKLTSFMEEVGITKDTTLSINIEGKDEINKLANTTNKMLSAINSANEEIVFLNYTDILTGLNNRAYMEKIFRVMDDAKDINYHIIMGDINGLKLTNDAFGYLEGDRLLYLVSKILKESSETDDIISRWGGDAFIILIKNKTRDYTMKLMETIKDRCENETEFHFKISIALGSAGSYEEASNAESVMGLAEKRMYRNKLLEDRSVRSSTICSLLRTLHEKHSETKEHTMRIKDLSVKLGKRIGLSKEKLDELEILSTLHDIGKIGIPEHILMKPSKLTDEEWCIMKTHSEIGYRIASSTPELAHIANYILAHHERYDGTGYPNKLKGEEIPLLSRIISIADSYDVMTHKRVYKQAFEKEYVVEELKRCSGTQFDPILVKEFIALIEEKLI